MRKLFQIFLFLLCYSVCSQQVGDNYKSNHGCAPTMEGQDVTQESMEYRADEFNQDKGRLFGAKLSKKIKTSTASNFKVYVS